MDPREHMFDNVICSARGRASLRNVRLAIVAVWTGPGVRSSPLPDALLACGHRKIFRLPRGGTD